MGLYLLLRRIWTLKKKKFPVLSSSLTWTLHFRHLCSFSWKQNNRSRPGVALMSVTLNVSSNSMLDYSFHSAAVFFYPLSLGYIILFNKEWKHCPNYFQKDIVNNLNTASWCLVIAAHYYWSLQKQGHFQGDMTRKWGFPFWCISQNKHESMVSGSTSFRETKSTIASVLQVI